MRKNESERERGRTEKRETRGVEMNEREIDGERKRNRRTREMERTSERR